MDQEQLPQNAKRKRDSSPKRSTICRLCSSSSSEYNFHRPIPAELNSLKGFAILKDENTLKFVQKVGICERHWKIDLNLPKSDRPRRFSLNPAQRPELLKEGPQLLPSTPKSRTNTPKITPQVPVLHAPPSSTQLSNKVRRLEIEATERERDLQELRSRLNQLQLEHDRTRDELAVAQSNLVEARSWSAISLAARNQLPLLTGQTLEQLQELFDCSKVLWTGNFSHQRPKGHPKSLNPFDTFVWMIWHLYRPDSLKYMSTLIGVSRKKAWQGR